MVESEGIKGRCATCFLERYKQERVNDKSGEGTRVESERS